MVQLGRSAGIVQLSVNPSVSDAACTSLADTAKRLAMHVVAANPAYLSVDNIPNEVLEKEKSIFR